MSMHLAPVQRRLVQEAIRDLEAANQKIIDALGQTDRCMTVCWNLQDLITDINSDILGIKDADC